MQKHKQKLEKLFIFFENFPLKRETKNRENRGKHYKMKHYINEDALILNDDDNIRTHTHMHMSVCVRASVHAYKRTCVHNLNKHHMSTF